MLEEQEALSRILEHTSPGSVIWVPLELSLDQILAQEVSGSIDSPPFDNSAMDGYAVRAEEATVGAELIVAPEAQAAGLDQGFELTSGHAIRIFTGAPIPTRANAVLMQEDVTREGDRIIVREAVEPGENIRRRGDDVHCGQLLLERGDLLNPMRIGLLASQGISEVPVYARPLVEIVTTGDEVINSDQLPLPGQIFNSNSPMLQATVSREGGTATACHVEDKPEQLRETFSRALESADLVIVVGGVSVGERDYVKDVLTDLGVETDFWRVNIKPGKPFLYGRHENGVPVFGLPGNPVSAFVTFTLFVAPVIRRLVGRDSAPGRLSVIASDTMNNQGERPHYMRGTIDGHELHLAGSQRSHAIWGLSQANCLIRLAPFQTILPGDPVDVLPI